MGYQKRILAPVKHSWLQLAGCCSVQWGDLQLAAGECEEPAVTALATVASGTCRFRRAAFVPFRWGASFLLHSRDRSQAAQSLRCLLPCYRHHGARFPKVLDGARPSEFLCVPSIKAIICGPRSGHWSWWTFLLRPETCSVIELVPKGLLRYFQWAPGCNPQH